MTDETLKQIRQEYHDMSAMAMKDYSELSKLESDSNVQRYIYLTNLKNKYNTGSWIQPPLWEVINNYGNGSITSSNPIWFRFHELLVEDYLKMFGVPLTGFEQGRMVTIYYDIENAGNRQIIYSDEKEIFEANNIILKGDTSIYDPMDRYDNARAKYFEWCITYGPDEALQMLKEEEQERSM